MVVAGRFWRSMRFLMLNWRDPKNPLAGGAERVTLAYLAGLVKRGHEAYWFTHAFPGCEPEDEIEGVKIVRGGGTVSSIIKARAWCRSQPKFDLVIDQHHGIPWFAPVWCGTNNVSYIHEVLGPIWSSFYSWPLDSIGRFQERWTHWGYRKVPFFTASSCTLAKLKEHGVRDIKQIPYGVDTRVLESLPPKSLEQPLKLVMVSRLAPNKRVHHGIKGVAALLKKGINAHLTIMGGGEEEEQLKTLAAEVLPDVHTFTGPVSEEEKDRILKESHLLLHTSQREGWGLNVIEANAMGTPTVVYPAEGLIESTLDGETGLVSKEQTPESLADRLADALEMKDQYQAWREAAWKRADSFHWENVLPRACEWFESKARGE